MDLSFNKVTYDGELGDFSEDDLQDLVAEYEKAQESNVAEFEKAAEATETIDESVIEDFEEARDSLIEEITDSESFDDVPLSEDALDESDFSELQEWRDFVLGGSEADEDDGGSAFNEMGKKSPTNTEGEETPDFVEEQLGDVPGLSL